MGPLGIVVWLTFQAEYVAFCLVAPPASTGLCGEDLISLWAVMHPTSRLSPA